MKIMKTLIMILALNPLIIASPVLLIIYSVFLSLRFPFCSIPSIAYRLEGGHFNYKDWYQRKFTSWSVAVAIGCFIVLPITTIVVIATTPLAALTAYAISMYHCLKELFK